MIRRTQMSRVVTISLLSMFTPWVLASETIQHDDGSTYVGTVEKGRMHGKGRFDNGAGLIYDGEWVHGKRHGRGTETRPDGSRYVGEWFEGKRSGSGRETWPDGGYHDGEWELNQPQGPGLRRSADGIEITGTFTGLMPTSGMLVLPSGETFAGPMYKSEGGPHPRFKTWLHTTAEAGDPWAQLMYARDLLVASRESATMEQMLKHLRSAEVAGLAEASYLLGMHLKDNDPDAANIHLERGAKRGYAPASRLLGELLLIQCESPGCEQSAHSQLQNAANKGDRLARRTLALRMFDEDNQAARDLIHDQAISFGDWQDLEILIRVLDRTRELPDDESEILRLLELALMDARQSDHPDAVAAVERLQLRIDRIRLPAGKGVAP